MIKPIPKPVSQDFIILNLSGFSEIHLDPQAIKQRTKRIAGPTKTGLKVSYSSIRKVI